MSLTILKEGEPTVLEVRPLTTLERDAAAVKRGEDITNRLNFRFKTDPAGEIYVSWTDVAPFVQTDLQRAFVYQLERIKENTDG